MLPDNFYCSPEYYDDEPEDDIGVINKMVQIDVAYESLFGEANEKENINHRKNTDLSG